MGLFDWMSPQKAGPAQAKDLNARAIAELKRIGIDTDPRLKQQLESGLDNMQPGALGEAVCNVCWSIGCNLVRFDPKEHDLFSRRLLTIGYPVDADTTSKLLVFRGVMQKMLTPDARFTDEQLVTPPSGTPFTYKFRLNGTEYSRVLGFGRDGANNFVRVLNDALRAEGYSYGLFAFDSRPQFITIFCGTQTEFAALNKLLNASGQDQQPAAAPGQFVQGPAVNAPAKQPPQPAAAPAPFVQGPAAAPQFVQGPAAQASNEPEPVKEPLPQFDNMFQLLGHLIQQPFNKGGSDAHPADQAAAPAPVVQMPVPPATPAPVKVNAPASGMDQRSQRIAWHKSNQEWLLANGYQVNDHVYNLYLNDHNGSAEIHSLASSMRSMVSMLGGAQVENSRGAKQFLTMWDREESNRAYCEKLLRLVAGLFLRNAGLQGIGLMNNGELVTVQLQLNGRAYQTQVDGTQLSYVQLITWMRRVLRKEGVAISLYATQLRVPGYQRPALFIYCGDVNKWVELCKRMNAPAAPEAKKQ